MFDCAAAGERLYTLRVALGRSRSDVARDGGGVLDETSLGRVETGNAIASTLRVRQALARGLGVRTDDLTDLLGGRLTVERVVERATATRAERLMLADAEHDTVVDLVLYLRDELASVVAERDRLQRACDEDLRRVRGALGAIGVADCDDPLAALEAVAADVPRRESEATDEHNATVARAYAEGRNSALLAALGLMAVARHPDAAQAIAALLAGGGGA